MNTSLKCPPLHRIFRTTVRIISSFLNQAQNGRQFIKLSFLSASLIDIILLIIRHSADFLSWVLI